MFTYKFSETANDCADISSSLTTSSYVSLLHNHNYFEVMIMLEGELLHLINGQNSILRAGDVLLVRPDDVHTMDAAGGGGYSFINLFFMRDVLVRAAQYLDAAQAVDQMAASVQAPHIKMPREKLNEYLEKHMQFAQYRRKRVLYLLLCDILVNGFLNGWRDAQQTRPEWVQQLCVAMNTPENLKQGVAQMQKISGKSAAHLSRSFRRYMGMTPTEYINALRIRYAALLLRQGRQSILDISFDCGFESVSYFYRLFEKQMGATPGAYRGRTDAAAEPDARDNRTGV